MARRSFEMYEIRQIIVCLRSGETIRGIAQTKLANRKKIRAVRKIAVQQNWLDIKKEIPADEVLATFFKPIPSAKVTQSSVLPYSKQIEEWCQQGIQGTTIHAALKRQHGFEGSYDSVQRFVKKTKDNLPPAVTTILEFKPGECAQVDFGYGPKLVDEVTGKVTKKPGFLLWSWLEVGICTRNWSCIRMLKRGLVVIAVHLNFLMVFPKKSSLIMQNALSPKPVITTLLCNEPMLIMQKDMGL